MTEGRAREVLQDQIDRYGQEYDAEGIEALEMAIKALEQQPCEDCVSREAVNYILFEVEASTDAHFLTPFKIIKNRINALQPIKPQRPPGKWLDKKMTIKGAHGMAYGRYACSVCKKKFPNKSNYCPNCGAEMEDSND